MTFDAENMENKIGTLAYEQPNLKKYGTMKELTYASQGSGGDLLGNTGRSDPGPSFAGRDPGSGNL